jgi:hypothetical protein
MLVWVARLKLRPAAVAKVLLALGAGHLPLQSALRELSDADLLT